MDIITSQGNVMINGDENTIFIRTNISPIVYKDAKKFVEDIPKLFKDVKGALLNVFCHHPIGYKTNMDFCEAISKKLDALHIRHSYLSAKYSSSIILLHIANINLHFNETVLLALIYDGHVCVTGLKYTENGYKEIFDKLININGKENAKLLRDEILGKSNPSKIVLVCISKDKPLVKFVRKTLKSNKLIAFDSMPDIGENFLDDISKWMFDKSFIKYHIIPMCERNYFFITVIGKETFPVLFLEKSEDLPFKKTCYVSRCNEKIIYGDDPDEKRHEIIAVEKRCHQNKITVTVDMENFIKVKHETIIFPQLEGFAMNLTSIHSEMKIPVIGILDGISVICLRKNNEYKFLDSWNDLYGKELAISFDEEKPKFFEDAFKALLKKPSFGVYDLIKVMSMSPDNIEIDEKWKFTLTKDSDNPVLLEFDTFEGTTKLSTPAFLMAMIIRQHLKAIKIEIGEKPNEIGICNFDNFNEHERIRVENQLKESCKMLKIECKFVRV
uniref:Uncharacterized protein n=1 Tax=Panagrolaimus sp. PS1159 TaxID=55785 RepID=A0AC35FWI7_9BILA